WQGRGFVPVGGDERRPPAGDRQLLLVAQRADEQPDRRHHPDEHEEEQRKMGDEAPDIDAAEPQRAGAGGDGSDGFGCGAHQRVPSSRLAWRTFQIMMGTTAIMMQMAIVEPRPKSPPPRNIQSNIRLASTWVSHCPLVIASTMSNTLSTTIVMVVQTTRIVGKICG